MNRGDLSGKESFHLSYVGRKVYSVVRIMLKEYDDRIGMIYSITGSSKESVIRIGLEHI